MIQDSSNVIKIAIGVDHRGVELKNKLIDTIFSSRGKQVVWHDVGCSDPEFCDYPRYAIEVCNSMRQGDATHGVLICGTGVGMAIAANRFPGIYAALVFNEEVARLSREHDMANVLVLPADYVTSSQAVAMVAAWLDARFKGGKYQTRIDMIDEIVVK